MTRTTKGILLRFCDFGFIVVANLLALSFVTESQAVPNRMYLAGTLLGLGAYFMLAGYLDVYKQVVRYSGFHGFMKLLICCVGTLITKLVVLVAFQAQYSLRYVILTFIFATMLIMGSRLVWRILHSRQLFFRPGRTTNCNRTLIIGTGQRADQLLTQLEGQKEKHTVVGLIEPDTQSQKMAIQDVKVVGTLDELEPLLAELAVKRVIVATTLSAAQYTALIELTSQLGIELLRMPSPSEALQSPHQTPNLREITISDLLERDELQLDIAQMEQQIKGQTILISGAGGSIGSEIVRQLVRFDPQQLLLLGHGENSIYLIKHELEQMTTIPIVPIIADIQDKQVITQIMQRYRPSIVYHAAAHKHVPLMEDNPHAAIKNNVFGTSNIAHAADQCGVQTFVMISSDKAVNPPNVMGATKRLAELIVTNLNHHSQTNFVVVRFGNVLGSRGSVVPLFKQQIAKGGPITITDFRMTRYFMTIPEASQLVIQAGALCQGGELFILDMGKPVKIYDLAKKMVMLSGLPEDQIEIQEVGIRPGEKLYEELLISGETANHQIHDKIFLGQVMQVEETHIVSFAQQLLQIPATEVRQKIVAFACKYNGETSVERVV